MERYVDNLKSHKVQYMVQKNGKTLTRIVAFWKNDEKYEKIFVNISFIKLPWFYSVELNYKRISKSCRDLRLLKCLLAELVYGRIKAII